MAKEAAEAFVKRYTSDETFRNKVTGFDPPEAARAYLDQEGFGQFSREELEDVRSAAGGELSDVELDAVAGEAWDVVHNYDYGDYSGSKWLAADGDCQSGYTCTSVW